MAIKATNQLDIVDLTDGVSVNAYPSSYSLAGNTAGKLAAATDVSVTLQAFVGSNLAACTTNANSITLPSGITVKSISTDSSPIVTLTVGTSFTNQGTVTIPVNVTELGVTITTAVTIAIAKTGETGPGAYNYFMSASPAAIIRAENGTLSTSKITVSCTRAQGTNSPAAYNAFYWAHYTTDGSTWTQISKSSSAVASLDVTVPTTAGVTAVRITAHTASPTDANRVDSQTIPIIDEGATGPQGEAAYTVILTNESHTFAADKDGKATASTVETAITAFKGATQVVATIGTITGQVTGLTTAIKSNTNGTTAPTVVITAANTLVTRQGVLTIPVTVDGKSFTKKFSWSLSPTGATGAQGPQGPQGEGGITLSITSSDGYIFKNTSAATTLTAHVYQNGTEVTGSALTALGTIKWYKDGGSTAIGTGSTLSIGVGDVTNHATYVAQLEG